MCNGILDRGQKRGYFFSAIAPSLHKLYINGIIAAMYTPRFTITPELLCLLTLATEARAWINSTVVDVSWLPVIQRETAALFNYSPQTSCIACSANFAIHFNSASVADRGGIITTTLPNGRRMMPSFRISMQTL